MTMLSVGPCELFHVDRGRGSPVLLLHGNPDSSSLWRGLIERLAPAHRCLAPDLPGFGRSPTCPGFDASLEGAAALIESYVTAARVHEPLSLVVHDLGGFLGLAFAVRHPGRLRRIAITNTVFHADYRWHVWARVWRTPILGELSMALMSRWSFVRVMRRGGPKLPSAYIEEAWRDFTPAVRREVLRLYRATDPRGFAGWEERLREVTRRVPTRVYWGERDPFIPARYADRFGAEAVRRFPDCGHWVPVEEREALGAELEAFFA